jgi:hypothetical protein
MPFEEIFIGSNHKSYKHKYFLACATNTNTNININTKSSLEEDKKNDLLQGKCLIKNIR